MARRLAEAVAWTRTLLVAGLPWLAGWRPELAAAAFAVAAASFRAPRPPERWRSSRAGVVILFAGGFLVLRVAPAAAAAWLAAAALVAAVTWLIPARGGRRPDAAELLALALWAGLQLVWPESARELGWLASGIVLLAARSGMTAVVEGRRRSTTGLGPPTREVRGTVSIRELVLAGGDGLPRSVPLELELRAGDSLAVLCDAPVEAEAIASTLAGRRLPAQGEICVDGVPMTPTDRVVAVVAHAERFLSGSLDENVAALAGAPLASGAAAAVREACGLSEVADALGGRPVREDGEPLSVLHRLLVLAARVIPSHYRIVVVLDAMPWVNAVRGELWRSAVVRASVGRTAVWITADRELAARADRTVVLRGGSLRATEPEPAGGRTR